MQDRASQLIDKLGLAPHPEGGHFKEVYRSPYRVTRDGVERAALTTIYFLLRAGEVSRWHVVASDEAWHFYQGDPLALVSYDPTQAKVKRTILGSESDDASAVHVVSAGVWQCARPTGAFSLVGCTVAPGFEFADFRFVRDVPGHEPPFEAALAPYKDLL